MIERGISKGEVADAINRGTKRVQNGKLIATYRHIEVMFKKIDSMCYVITVMLRW